MLTGMLSGLAGDCCLYTDDTNASRLSAFKLLRASSSGFFKLLQASSGFFRLLQASSGFKLTRLLRQVQSTKHQVPSTKYQVPSIRYQVPSSSYQIELCDVRLLTLECNGQSGAARIRYAHSAEQQSLNWNGFEFEFKFEFQISNGI